MGQLNLNGIKNAVKNILDAANTTTGSPVDLSANLTNRVSKVLTVNPDLIPIQDDYFPCVTVHYDSKSMNQDTIAQTMTNAKRKAELILDINAAVIDYNIDSPANDSSSDQIEYLAENIEEILRANPDLSATAKWSMVDSADYYGTALDQETSFRGVKLSLKVTQWY